MPHYWKSLPHESALRADYAPPAKVESQYWIAVLAVLAGIGFLFSGAILLGVLLPLGGLFFGAVNHASVEEYRSKLAKWSDARICLACPRRF